MEIDHTILIANPIEMFHVKILGSSKSKHLDSNHALTAKQEIIRSANRLISNFFHFQ